MMEEERPKDYARIYSEEMPKMDGAKVTHKIEGCVDLVAVARRLKNLPAETNRHAIDVLNRHYTEFKRKDKFKVYLQYFEDKETYVVKVDEPSLRAIKAKLPKRGSYRYFFQQPDRTLEELDSDDAAVPYHEKSRHIFCQIFPNL